jgi:DeoR/GlpR family transcriptional regulator of sugar metabolism
VILLILRQKQILEKLEGEGEITIKELATRFNVSEMTIHRDVDALQKQHYVYKKRGAVVYIENNDRTNSDFYAEEKRAIGVRAASLLEDGQSVIFDNSTTALECAKHLDPSGKYTFYATGLETAAILSRYENSVLYVSGGYYFPASNGLVGAIAENFVNSLKADVCIIGASGVSVECGITTPYPMHTALQKAIIAAAKTKILVCDHSKFDKAAMEHICDLKDIDILVTDGGVLEETHKKYSKYLTLIKA